MRGQTNHNFKQVVNENVLLGLQREEKSEVCIDSYEWYLETHFNKINKKEEEKLGDDMSITIE
ncbi:MAG: hypothetical protein HOP21_03030, partial [Methylotenera sp.]|nr:hypothetical protein [Methylotenera sp.]